MQLVQGAEGRRRRRTATAHPTSARRGSTTPASRSAASTACSCSASSRTSARACRTSPAARSSRSRGSARLQAARRDLAALPVAVAVQQPGTGSVPHELQREHAAPEPADRDGHRPGRLGDPDADRQHRVGAAGGEPGRLRAVHHRAGDHPVRARRQDGAEPDGVGDHPRRQPRSRGRRSSGTTSWLRRTRP